jgi:DNA-binding CsgD family transcriptional regulator
VTVVGRRTFDCRTMTLAQDAARPAGERLRAAEVIAALSLGTDLGIGVPLEHGLQSALFARRLSDRVGADAETARQAYYLCLLFYVGCTAGAEMAADVFGGDDALTTYATPVRFGTHTEMLRGMARAVAPPEGSVLTRAVQLASGLPKLAREFRGHVAAACEVGRMLSERLGLPAAVGALFAHADERWDGKGIPGRAAGGEIPLSVRVAQVARDAAFHRMLGGPEQAARVVGERAGGASDPPIGRLLADGAEEIPDRAADAIANEASAGMLDVDAVAAVIEAAGHAIPTIERPAGLTDREAQAVGLIARGLQTKQVAAALSISVKTADRHIQNAYAKLGVSTRAAATLLAVEHGLLAWGEFPIPPPARRS